jgi:hypothetical protein
MEKMFWVSSDDKLPENCGFYFVWVPEWEDNIAHGDIAYWNGSKWSDGNFPSIDDGAPVSHWMRIEPQQAS